MNSDAINILVVDDLPEKLLVYRTILEEPGLNVVTASSGPQALKQVLNHSLAVILLDVNMPGMNGFETAALIRQRKKFAHTPIIFVTAFQDDLRPVEGYAHGAVDYMLAPVAPEVLRAKVRVFVDLFRMHRQVERQAEERVALAEERGKRAAAEEANRRKDEFLAMLAHELRNPLAPIRNAVEIMRQLESVGPEMHWIREMIDRQLRRMTRLVDDLLDVSRITRGKIRLQLGAVDVAAAVTSAVETSRPLVEARKHELTVVLPSKPIQVMADSDRLAQVLSNLLNNAAKYTDEGGRICLTVTRDEHEVVFSVRDTGAGIPAEMLPRIFELFTQVDQSLDRAQGGLGIGLTLVRRLVEMHQGSVQALSAGPGQGSEFVVRLPILAAAPSPPSPVNGVNAAPVAAARARVLVVDDNVDAADTLATLVRLSGHEVRTAYDGPAALVAAQEYRPEVVLLDIGLPGLDGYEVARRLRCQTEGEHVLIAAVTGYGQDQDRSRSQQAGFDAHLVKPVELAALHALFAKN
jgi:signal transduction histidine kinase